MNSYQIADETFVAADPALVGAVVGDPARWRRWWPDLRLTVIEERGPAGVRWQVAGPLTGTMEIWLEPELDGVILHYFLHAEPTGVTDTATLDLAGATGKPRARRTTQADDLAELNHRRRVAGKKMSFEVKAELERGRGVGMPPAS